MKSITSELIMKICIFTITVCFLLVFINSSLMRNNALESMDTAVSASTEAYAFAIENAIQVFKNNIETIAKEAPITPEMTVEEIKAICVEYEKKYNLLSVSFIDANGVSYDSVDLSEREYFKSAMSGTTYISSPLISKRPAANNAVVLYIAAKMSSNGGYEGVAFAELSNDLFSQMIQDVRIGEKGYGFMIDKTGTIIAHKDNALVESFTNYITLGEQDSSYKEVGSLISDAISKKTGKQSIHFEGSNKYIAYAP